MDSLVRDAVELSQPTGASEQLKLKPADELRLARMLRSYHRRLWSAAYRLSGNRSVAEDLVQQAYVIAASRLSDITEEGEYSYLLTVVVRQVRRYRRLAYMRRETPEEEFEAVADPQLAVDEEVERRRARRTLQDVLTKMSDESREVFILHELEGMTVFEICELTGAPQGTVASRLRRARAQFRKEVRKLHHGGRG